jgi:DNA processing protein
MINVLPHDQTPRSISDLGTNNLSLWYEGNLSLLSMRLVSIVGTRNISNLGQLRTAKLTRILVEQGYCVVSGLAKGVDTIAHKTTLDLGGFTIAVLGTPIDQCYPKENLALKQRIAEQGLVLSQFPVGQKVYQSNFPKRNALMAALSELTIVVEAGLKSGTRYQVKEAIRMHRKVGFLASVAQKQYPWIIDALNSGCADVIEDPADVGKLLQGGTHTYDMAKPTQDKASRFDERLQLSLPLGSQAKIQSPRISAEKDIKSLSITDERKPLEKFHTQQEKEGLLMRWIHLVISKFRR